MTDKSGLRVGIGEMAKNAIPLHPRVQRMDERSSFWQTHLSPGEGVLLAIGTVGAVVLHLDPVLNAGFAKPLLFLLGVVCFLSPVTGFFFLAASAILPTASADTYALVRELTEAGDAPAGMIDSGTKYAFWSWLVAFPLRYHRLRLREMYLLWPMVPWLLWMVVTNGPSAALDPDLIKSTIFCLMACQLAGEAKGAYLKCLLGLGLGFLVVTVGFWAKTLGLPVQLADWGGQRGDFHRLGSVVADSVMLWPPLLCGLGIVLGVAGSFSARVCPLAPPRWLPYASIALFVLSVPPLLAAMTNSGLIGLVSLVVVLVFGVARARASGQVGGRRWHSLSLLLCGLALAVAVLLASNALQTRDQLVGLFGYYEQKSSEIGVAASRNAVWEASLDTISRYPLVGVNLSGGTENIPAGYEAKGYFLSHNVFLDYGRAAGIPGMLLFAWFFFWPSIKLLQGRGYLPYSGFFLGHLMFLLFFLSLSFQWYKPFWVFWMLAALVGSRVAEGATRGGVRAVLKRRGPARKLTAAAKIYDMH